MLVDANEYTDVPPNAPKDAAPTGEVVVPFSSSPNARRAIVIQKGDYACLDHFSHKVRWLTLTWQTVNVTAGWQLWH